MSDASVARWKSIPMEWSADGHNMKRSRPEHDDSDDNVSLVSHSPSPEPEGMDVDPDTYREHVRGPVQEVITVETRIRPENKGFALLAKMGWTEGQPLGLSADGRVDPVPFQLKNDATGIGKITQDIRMIQTTVSQRKGLEAERQQKESDDQRKAREELVARKTAVENEISSVLRAFYCELCDKQFKTVAQYDEHTNSYGHHHKVRLRDMTANARPTSKDDLDKRKEKERRREEKELRKIAAAAGVKMPKLPASASSTSAIVPTPDSSYSSSTSQTGVASESQSKKGGWTTVSSPASSELQKAVCVTAGSTPKASSSGSNSPRAQTAPTTLSQVIVDSHTSPPAFRNAGWTSLDPGISSQPLAAQPPPPLHLVPSAPSSAPTPVPVPHSSGGWKQFQSSMKGKKRR